MSTTDPADAADVLLGPADIRELAAALGVRPTKQRGQNFVIDANTVRRIVRTAEVRPDLDVRWAFPQPIGLRVLPKDIQQLVAKGCRGAAVNLNR